jgi:hypothetical protein
MGTPLTVRSKKYFGIAAHHRAEADVAGMFRKEAIAVEFRFTLVPFLRAASHREIYILVWKSGRDQPQIDYDEKSPYKSRHDYLLRSTLSGGSSAESLLNSFWRDCSRYLLRISLSDETTADSLLRSSLSRGPSLQMTIISAPTNSV